MHRLVLFTGSRLGSGKSTLSDLLHQQLTAQGIPAIWLQEERLDAIFGQYAPGWQINTIEPETFLMACEGFLTQYQQSDAVLITDSVLPGSINFFGRFPVAYIEQYNARLYQLLQPRDPLLIYLQTDIATAFARATAQRGEQWFESIRSYLNTWRLPLYTKASQPFTTRQDVLAYFTALDRLARHLVSQWPGPTHILDTT
jgi:thymidylate kinase